MKKIECINIIQETGKTIISLDGSEYEVSLTDLQKVTGDLFGEKPKKMLRPSALPKLAECPCFSSAPIAGDAAIRGNKMDLAFRNLLMNMDEFRATEHLTADEKSAVKWAVSTIRTLCGNEPIIADKKRCTFPQWHPQVSGGEADAICPTLGKLFDLKSGQIRNYWEQQACYAKSVMEAEFLDSLDCTLLFCDQREIVTRTFTYAETAEIVENVIKSVNRGDAPRICDYCSWCAQVDTCPLRTSASRELTGMTDSLDDTFLAISADPVRLADFVTKAGVVSAYEKKGKEKILEYINNGIDVPGFKRVSRKGTNTVPVETVTKYANWIGIKNIISTYGSMREDQFRKLFSENLPNEPFPEDAVITGAGSSYIKKTAVKNTPKK